MNRGTFDVEEAGEDLVGLVEGMTLPAGNVEDAAGDALSGSLGGEQVGADGVIDVGEVAALRAG